jgi:hypothetical protein
MPMTKSQAPGTKSLSFRAKIRQLKKALTEFEKLLNKANKSTKKGTKKGTRKRKKPAR